MLFGPGREKTPKEIKNSDQLSIFDDSKEEQEQAIKEITEATKEIVVKSYKRKINKTGIRKDKLKDFEFEMEEYELPDDEKCDICGSSVEKIGRKLVRRNIKYVPAKLVLVSVFQNTYKCTSCGGKDSENPSDHFVQAPVPRPILNHSIISPSLAAQVIYQKYFMGMPLNRQESFWFDRGLSLPRATTAHWCNQIAEYYLKSLRDLMHKRILETNELVMADETRIQCNHEKGRKASTDSFMWVLRSGDEEKNKGVIFKYSISRDSSEAISLLKGFKGIFVTDAYSGYNKVPDAIHAKCWSHTRRKFLDSIPTDNKHKPIAGTKGEEGLKFCNKLFEIEQELTELSNEERLLKRQELSKPVYEAFLVWINELSKKVITNQKLSEAITYVRNHYVELGQFLNDGRIPLSSNLVERSIRPFAVHRRAWLFADTPKGAVTNAVMYSIVESAKLNDLNLFKYIEHLLTELPQLDDINNEDELENYLPWSDKLPTEIKNTDTDVIKVNKSLLSK
jgi:transposase